MVNPTVVSVPLGRLFDLFTGPPASLGATANFQSNNVGAAWTGPALAPRPSQNPLSAEDLKLLGQLQAVQSHHQVRLRAGSITGPPPPIKREQSPKQQGRTSGAKGLKPQPWSRLKRQGVAQRWAYELESDLSQECSRVSLETPFSRDTLEAPRDTFSSLNSFRLCWV